MENMTAREQVEALKEAIEDAVECGDGIVWVEEKEREALTTPAIRAGCNGKVKFSGDCLA